MKINYRTHPILEQIFTGNIDRGLKCFSVDDSFLTQRKKDSIGGLLKLMTTHCSPSVNVVSESFYVASKNSMDKLWELFCDILNDKSLTVFLNEIFLFRNFVQRIMLNKIDGGCSFWVLTFNKDGHLLHYTVKEDGYDRLFSWASHTIALTKEEKSSAEMALLVLGTVFYMFKTYASVETKIIEPHERIRDVGCKYINETNIPITYLDSKWFTNLVKSDAFKVRGHFRLQPKKVDGKWTRELIWINDFLKTGYTSPAKILSN